MADAVSIPIPNEHQIMLRDLRDPELVNIRHWDIEAERLAVMRWPVFDPSGGSPRGRIPPSDLAAYRCTHKFKFPCCLCPFLSQNLGQLDRSDVYTEAAIYCPMQGIYKGEYVAQCAGGRCGYLLPIEQIYWRPGVQTKRYPRRGPDDPAPAPVFHYTEVPTEVIRHRAPQARNATPGPARALNRTYATAELVLDPMVISPSPPRVQARFTFATDTVPERYGTPMDLFRPAPLNRGPSIVEGWQYLKQECVADRFKHLISKCDGCGVLKKNGAFHICAPPEIIDLTGDDSDDMDWVFTDRE